MVYDGATEVTYYEPKYCEEHILDSGRHRDIMPQAGMLKRDCGYSN
jgi:hypothetical protein